MLKLCIKSSYVWPLNYILNGIVHLKIILILKNYATDFDENLRELFLEISDMFKELNLIHDLQLPIYVKLFHKPKYIDADLPMN